MEPTNPPTATPPQATLKVTSFPELKVENKIWTVAIPTKNILFLVLCLLPLLFLDIPLLINAPELFPFFVPMVISVVVLLCVTFGEFILVSNYKSTTSKIDILFVFLVFIRDIVFFLNVLPFIQLGGIAIFAILCIPYSIIYDIAVRKRNKSIPLFQNNK